MGLSAHLPARSIRSLAETHPRLSALRARLIDDLHIEPGRASQLIVSLVRHAVDDLGDAFLGEMGRRLQRIDTIRGRIAGAIDHVVAEGILPSDLGYAALTRLFDELQAEMQGLQNVRHFAESHPPTPTIEHLTGAIDRAAVVGTPSTSMLDAMARLRDEAFERALDAMPRLRKEDPALAEAFQHAFREQRDLLGRAVLAEHESAQLQALAQMRANASPELRSQWGEVEAAVRFMGRQHSRARTGPGSAAAAVRAQRMADLPDDLRAAIGGDRTVLGPLAEQHPADLADLWGAWNAGNSDMRFRDYVYAEMRSGRRPELAEWQAAHDVANQYGMVLLKDPASYDPAAPNLRRVNPREGGTDLLGVREDGEIWYIDDKSHRLSPSQRAAGRQGINVSSVSAFEGRAFIANMFDDVAEIEAGFQRMRAAGHTPEPRAVEAAERLRRAAEALKRETQGWSEADFAVPANRQRIAAILGAPEHRIRLRVTSTMGDVTGVTPRLKNLGIETLPRGRGFN